MSRVRRLLSLCLALAILALPYAAQAKKVLIIDTNNPVMGSPVVTGGSLLLGSYQTDAGNTVTYSGLVLPKLTDFDQIWDMRSRVGISDGLQSDYLAFLQGGGSLAVIGELEAYVNPPVRTNSILALIDLVGAGKVTTTGPAGAQNVLAPFDGPFPVSAIQIDGDAGGFYDIGHGKGITQNSFGYGGAAFEPGTLDNAPLGRLVFFMSKHPFYPNDGVFPSSGTEPLVRNIIHYLGDDPVRVVDPPPGRGAVPEPATWSLMLLGMGAIGASLRLRRVAIKI